MVRALEACITHILELIKLKGECLPVLGVNSFKLNLEVFVTVAQLHNGDHGCQVLPKFRMAKFGRKTAM